MGSFRTGFGEPYRLERRLPRLAWRPRFRGRDGALDLLDVPGFDDELGIFAAIAVFIFAIVLLLVVVPFLLLVAEFALVLAIVLPLMLLAVAVGVVRHSVVLRRVDLVASGDAPEQSVVVSRREVRGVIASVLAARQMRAAAEGGEFRLVAAPASAADQSPG